MAARARMEDASAEGSLDLVQSIEEDPLLDTRLPPHHSLQAHFSPSFQPLPTALMAVLLLLIHVLFVVLAFLTGMLCSYPDPKEDRCPGNYTSPLKAQSVIVLGKVALWLLHLLLERYLQHHHDRVRGRGYSHIDRATRPLKSLALLTHSAGNAALLLVLGAQHSFPGPGTLYLALILAVLALELLCSMTWLLLYAVKIRKFNRAKPQPDVLEEEKICSLPNGVPSETGFRTSSHLEAVVEKQADVIAHLRRHNALLSRRLLALAASEPGSQHGRT